MEITEWNGKPITAQRVRVRLANGSVHRATRIENKPWADGKTVFLDDEPWTGQRIAFGQDPLSHTLKMAPYYVPEMSGWRKVTSGGYPNMPHRELRDVVAVVVDEEQHD